MYHHHIELRYLRGFDLRLRDMNILLLAGISHTKVDAVWSPLSEMVGATWWS